MIEQSEYIYYLWLKGHYRAISTVPKRLLDTFGSAKKIYYLTEQEILETGLFTRTETAVLAGKSLHFAKSTDEYCFRENIGILCYGDDNYPSSLRLLSDCPIVLFFKGILPNFEDNLFITMVGTRKMSSYGARVAHKASFETAVAGAVVVSGMASGIDSVCHKGAIDACGTTLAVLGCGIDVIYPPDNILLYEKIIVNGAIITEFLPSTQPIAENFPKRNRIMAALSQAVVVVEAGIGSGALITSDRAIKSNIPVYAFPGSVAMKSSAGNNELIRDGAVLVLNAYDFLRDFEALYPHKINIDNIHKKQYFVGAWEKGFTLYSDKNENKANEKEEATTVSRANELKGDSRIIYERLLDGAKMPEKLTDEKLTLAKVLSILSFLEIDNYVKSLPGGLFCIKK